MTIEEFVHELKQLREQFIWGLVPDTGRFAERRAWPRYRIRAQLDDPTSGPGVFDPIGAVCYAKTGKVFLEGEWAEAAAELGLSKADGDNLIAAANDRTWAGQEGKRRPVKELQELRVVLIEAVEEIAERVGR